MFYWSECTVYTWWFLGSIIDHPTLLAVIFIFFHHACFLDSTKPIMFLFFITHLIYNIYAYGLFLPCYESWILNLACVYYLGLGHSHNAEEISRNWLFAGLYSNPWLLSVHSLSCNDLLSLVFVSFSSLSLYAIIYYLEPTMNLHILCNILLKSIGSS